MRRDQLNSLSVQIVLVEAPNGESIEGQIVDGTWDESAGCFDLGEPFRIATDDGLVWCRSPWACHVELLG